MRSIIDWTADPHMCGIFFSQVLLSYNTCDFGKVFSHGMKIGLVALGARRSVESGRVTSQQNSSKKCEMCIRQYCLEGRAQYS